MEKLETINEFLKNQYGIDTDDGEPMWRVVWSEDQTELRETKYTDEGIELLYPEVRRLPKYNYVKNAYILERRVLVPDVNLKELAGQKKSYEPYWVFVEASTGNPIPPSCEACKFIADTVYAAEGKSSLAHYKSKEPEKIMSAQENFEANKKRLDDLENKLWGDESGLNGDTITNSGSTIIVPQNYDTVKH